LCTVVGGQQRSDKIEDLNRQMAKLAAHGDGGEELASIKHIEVQMLVLTSKLEDQMRQVSENCKHV
jgi:hypothetical protein